MILMSRTLLARTFLLIATLLALSTTAWYVIFRTYEREPQVNQVTRLVVSVVNLTRTALVAAQPSKRTALLEELEELEGIQLYPFDSAQLITPVDDAPMLRKVQAAVRLELGEETRFAQTVGGVSGFWISFSMEGDEYWVVLPADRIPQDRTLQWLGWGLLVLLLSLAGAYSIVSRVTQPLKRLAAAARQIGLGLHPLPVAEAGPEELRDVARTFNEMNRDLARLDEDRALILAGVSHDLRTPLARMRLAIEMMASDADLKTGMSLDIDEMDRIIGQFLDFARTEDSEKLLPLDLAALAGDLASAYRERGRSIELDTRPTPMIAARPFALRRMVANLIDNAFRYAEVGIAMRTFSTAEAVTLEVLDRGPGIPESEVTRLKQPFQRLESARSGREGTGLGLAIVDRIARMHHGQFDLLPRAGGGLIARLRFPIQS